MRTARGRREIRFQLSPRALAADARRRAPWVILNANRRTVSCERCYADERLTMHVPLGMFLKQMDDFKKKHRACELPRMHPEAA